MIYVIALMFGFIASTTEKHILPNKVDNKLIFFIFRTLFISLAGVVLGLLGFLLKVAGFTGGFLLLTTGVILFIISLSHIPVFPKIVVLGLRRHHHSSHPVIAGFSNIFASSPSLHAIMALAIAHGYAPQSGLLLLLFALGSSIRLAKFTKGVKKVITVATIFLFFFTTTFVIYKGLLYTQLYHLSPFEKAKTAIIPEILDENQFLRTDLNSINGRFLIGDNYTLQWLIEGEGERIYIPSYKYRSTITEDSDFITIDKIKSPFIYFTSTLGKGDYILKVSPNITDYYNHPYARVIDSGFGEVHEDEEFSEISYPEIKVESMKVAIVDKENNTQIVNIDVNETGYTPSVIVLQEGVPATLNFTVTSLTKKNYRIIIPSYNELLEFIQGDNPINITDPLVDFTFYSWEGDYGGYVLVVEEPDSMTLERAQRQVKMLNTQGI